MGLYKPYLFVLISIFLLLPYVFGDHDGSTTNSNFQRLVSSVASPTKKSAKSGDLKIHDRFHLRNYWRSKRLVPESPNRKHNSIPRVPAATPFTVSSIKRDINYLGDHDDDVSVSNYWRSKRLVPESPNPKHNSVPRVPAATPFTVSSIKRDINYLGDHDDDVSVRNYWRSKRLVPESPNPKHNSVPAPPFSIKRERKYLGFESHEFANNAGSSNIYDEMRLVPSGPNRAVSPEKFPTNAHVVGN